MVSTASVIRNTTIVNSEYEDNIDWQTLLTTQVENLHAVSHFKHETFNALEYATDFGTISKESIKRITKWGAKYYTHPSSYYPVPQTSMSFRDAKFMTPLPCETLSKKDEETMKEWLENYRPVRQRTVRSETTKDKAGALPPAVQNRNLMLLQGYDFQLTRTTNRPLPSLRSALLSLMCH